MHSEIGTHASLDHLLIGPDEFQTRVDGRRVSFGKGGVEYITEIGGEPAMKINPVAMSFDVRIHSWKWGGHEHSPALNRRCCIIAQMSVGRRNNAGRARGVAGLKVRPWQAQSLPHQARSARLN